MSTFLEECITACGAAWRRYERHPWFEALETGSLTLRQFKQFQLEDAPFIPVLHVCMAYGVAKAPTGSPWALATASVLHNLFVARELQTKREILASLGVSDVRFDRWALSPRREAYANHLLRAALEGSTGQIATSLLPCTFFTQVVGRRFEGVEIRGPAAFSRWAAVYADKRMYGMVEAHAEMAEWEARQSTEAREHLVRLFVRSLQHQVAVFDDAIGPRVTWPDVSRVDLNSRELES